MKKLIIVLCLLLFCAKGYCADISRVHSFLDGEILTAAYLNNEFDPIISTVNDLDGENLASDIAITSSGNMSFSGTVTTTGNTLLGNGADTLTINASTGITYTPAATWTFTGAQTVSGTWADLGAVTTIDINGGTLGAITIDGNWTAVSQTCANLGTVTTADINAGTWQGTIDGAWTAASQTCADLGSVTTCDINGGTITGITDLATADGGTGSSSTTYCSLTANVTGSLPMANLDTVTVANGGTGATTAATALTALGAMGFSQTIHKIGNDTHDVSVTGTQEITGIGFAPRYVVLIVQNGAGVKSWGFDDGTDDVVFYDNTTNTDNVFVVDTGMSIRLQNATGTFASANITATSADSFTLTWSKTGTPTGTASFIYLAFR